jgi:hypothetical protein
MPGICLRQPSCTIEVLMRSRTLLIATGLALAVSACGTTADEQVVPFEQIAVTGPDIEADLSGTAAVLTVETSIDAFAL